MCLLMVAATTLTWTGCKKKSDSSSSATASALVIQTGARTIEPDESMTYTAVVVDSKGNTTPATNITWSVTNSLGNFTGSTFKPTGSGYGTITASTTVNGTTLTAKVAVGVYLPAVFSVVPSAIIWTTNAGTIPLSTVYLGTGSVSGYTYSSSNTAVATVEGSGVVSFAGTGECVITVTANGLSANNVVKVPVLVVGMPTATLPVARVAVNPAGAEIFRGETATFTAKAYNTANTETSATFTWASQDVAVATVSSSGVVTAVGLGQTIITATASGIVGQAEVSVLPDTTIIVTPIMASISAGGTKQFNAQAYAVNHSTKMLNAISMPTGLTWEIPTTGIAMFDIASVNSTGLVTMSSSASLGLSTVVIAHVSSHTIEPGAGLVMVSDCNCGTTTAGVHHINITGSTTISASLMAGPVAVVAAAVDASNNPIAGATVHLCSDNMAVATVDGMNIVPVGPGTAIITVCNGDVQTTITLNVTL